MIVAPGGEVAMIDYGRWNACDNITDYAGALGITMIDYAFATHYDADHIGCLDDLSDDGVSIGSCIDRGGAGTTQTYQDYADTCAGKRSTASKGQVVTLGGGVTIAIVDLNGAGVSTSDENALGLVLKVSYGTFDHEFAGDLPGEDPNIESVVAGEIGDVDVCKVHHHGSKFSSNDDWLSVTQPEVCILSVGGNPYGHPTEEALGRLHDHGVTVFWTNLGSGVAPGPMDHVCAGSVLISVALPADYAVACE